MTSNDAVYWAKVSPCRTEFKGDTETRKNSQTFCFHRPNKSEFAPSERQSVSFSSRQLNCAVSSKWIFYSEIHFWVVSCGNFELLVCDFLLFMKDLSFVFHTPAVLLPCLTVCSALIGWTCISFLSHNSVTCLGSFFFSTFLHFILLSPFLLTLLTATASWIWFVSLRGLIQF